MRLLDSAVKHNPLVRICRRLQQEGLHAQPSEMVAIEEVIEKI